MMTRDMEPDECLACRPIHISGSLIFKTRFKRRILHVPHLMQMRRIYCFRSF